MATCRVFSRTTRASLFKNSSGISLNNIVVRQQQPLWMTLMKGSGIRWNSYPAHEVVGMPVLSPTMKAGSIAQWRKNEGDEFAPGDILCEVETDKATVDFEAQDEGVIAKILKSAGSAEIKCGDPIMIVVEGTEDVAAFKDYEPDSIAAATPPPPPVAEAPVAAPAAVAPPPTPAAAPTAPASGGKTIASPLARMLAKESGHDISQIAGTGPGGRIIAADVKEFTPPLTVAAPAPAAPAVAPTPVAIPASAPAAAPIVSAGYTDYPLSPSAQQIAAQLTASKATIPHYYLTVDLCLDAMLSLRFKLNTSSNTEISLNDLLVKATACAIQSVPSTNASWMDTFVRMYDDVHVNVAVGSGDTFMMALISDVAKKGVGAIAKDFGDVVHYLEETSGSLPQNLTGMGTFTLINLGMYGVKSCAPIITSPQSCALALGAAENRIVPNTSSSDSDDDEIYKQSVMLTATLSCDHRVVDGAVGAQWLSAFKEFVEKPEKLVL